MRASVAVALLAAIAAPASAQRIPQIGRSAEGLSELASSTQLRVCADPHNLPFSNDKGEGFENKIAQLIGQDLKVPVVYTFFPDSQGFVRATLMRNKCDVIMGTVAGANDLDSTQSYYHTGYEMVTRKADGLKATGVGDKSLASKRFGLIGGTPPTDLLVAHSLMDQTQIYALMVDTRVRQPAHTLLEDLVANKVDVALEWGPIAGYYIKQESLPLTSVFLDAQGTNVKLDYYISMGVRPGDTEFRRKLNGAIGRHQAEITHILQDYGVPLLDQQNHPLSAAGAAAPG